MEVYQLKLNEFIDEMVPKFGKKLVGVYCFLEAQYALKNLDVKTCKSDAEYVQYHLDKASLLLGLTDETEDK